MSGLGTTAALAAAQVPPSPGEIAAYQGLHAAAQRGDVAQIARLIQSGAAVDATDAAGRTPLHVATFARKPDAVRALIVAGADHARLEQGRYDAVTIAAVADDEDTLRVLLQLGASAKQVTSRYDGTALIAAAHLGHDGVVRQLIAAGAPLYTLHTDTPAAFTRALESLENSVSIGAVPAGGIDRLPLVIERIVD